jgi:hypothetical protein
MGAGAHTGVSAKPQRQRAATPRQRRRCPLTTVMTGLARSSTFFWVTQLFKLPHAESARRAVPEQDHFLALDLFRATAARTRVFNASSFIVSPSRKSIARRVLPSRLELKRLEGSFRDAPFANVIFTTFL